MSALVIRDRPIQRQCRLMSAMLPIPTIRGTSRVVGWGGVLNFAPEGRGYLSLITAANVANKTQ